MLTDGQTIRRDVLTRMLGSKYETHSSSTTDQQIAGCTIHEQQKHDRKQSHYRAK